jgi:Raf kinase inhibitor-like YbhB/YbcL family protein
LVRSARSARPAAGSWRLLVIAVAAIALAPLVSGCSWLNGLGSQRLRTPQLMTITSPDFSTGVRIPPRYTCDGAGQSPPLYWSGAPQAGETKSFAIVVDDSQAPITPYVYWIVFDISPATTALAQNRLPPGARVAQNSRGLAGYDPPCPAGRNGHLYRFTVYALNARLRLPEGAGLRKTWSAIAVHVIGTGRLTALAKP